MKFKIEILKSKIEFQDEDLNQIKYEICASEHQSLLKQLIKNKIQIDHSCGGNATCGTCQIEIIKGTVTEKEDLEIEFCNDRHMKDNERLSCQIYPKSDLVIRIKNQTKN